MSTRIANFYIIPINDFAKEVIFFLECLLTQLKKYFPT